MRLFLENKAFRKKRESAFSLRLALTASLIFLFHGFIVAQPDSLVSILKKKLSAATSDTARLNIYSSLTDVCDESDILYWCNEGLKLCEEKLKAPATDIEKKFLLGQKMIFINNSGYYFHQNDPGRALEFYYQAHELATQLKDSISLGTSLMNIGQIHFSQGNIEKAQELFKKCHAIKISSGDKDGLADVFLNLGNVYNAEGKKDSAIYFTEKSLAIRKEIGDYWGICNSLVNLCNYYLETKQSNVAKQKMQEACETERKLRDTKVKAHCMVSMSKVYHQLRDYKLSLTYADSAIAIGCQFNYMEILSPAYHYKYLTLKIAGNTKEAFDAYHQYILFSDSLKNLLESREIFRKEEKHEYEKRTAADSVRNGEKEQVKNAQIFAQVARLKQEAFQRYSLLSGLLLVIAGLLFAINRFRHAKKQNALLAEKSKIIEEQKKTADTALSKLTERNKEVIDSIQYANRIQTALFPSEKYIERKLHILKKRL